MSVISKAEAIRALEAAGATTATGFAAVLKRRGLPVAGPWHAHTILVRLKRQGLATATDSFSRKDTGDPDRLAPRRRSVLWKVTDRGIGRAEWLEDSRGPRKALKPAANPRVRRGKRRS